MDRIPAEILDGILDYLLEDEGPTTPADCTTPLDSDPYLDSLRNLRLVCKTFRDAVAERFWAFFENYSVLLECNSLKKLKRISQNKHIRCRLLVIWVYTYQFKQCLTEWPKFKQAFREERAHERQNYLNLKMDGQAVPSFNTKIALIIRDEDELPFTGTKIMKAYQAYKQLYEQQEKMKASGERKALLSEIFELLDGHVRAINVCGGWCGTPFRPITEKIGVSHFHSADRDEDNGPDKTRAVCDIIHSIYWSRIRLCGLNWVCADSDILDLPDRTLRYLRKSRIGDCQFHDIKLNLASNAVLEVGTSSIHKVLQACPNVESLELKFPEFSAWQVDIRYLFGTKHYKHLAHLHIAGFTTNAEDLAKLMHRHRDTLRCIELCDIILEQGSWASVFKFMHDHLKLEQLGINQLFQPGITILHCFRATNVMDYVLRKTDTMDWPLFQEKSLCRTPNRFFAVDRLTEMLGDAAAFQAMILEPAFWLNDDKLTSDGPQELMIKDGDDLDWEVEHEFITDPDSDDDSDFEKGDISEADGEGSEENSDDEDSDGWETDEAQPQFSVAQARFAEFSAAAIREVAGTGAANPVLVALAAFGQGEDEDA